MHPQSIKKYEFICRYMEEMGWTEDEYIDNATHAYRNLLTIEKLYAINDIDVEKLTERATIIYANGQ